MKASSGGTASLRITDPLVVDMSAVSMLSFSRTGMQCSGPRGPEAARSSSSSLATSSALGLTVMMLLRRGPASS